MEMGQKQNLVQAMRQEQTMTFQQIQALEMLFLPILELQTVINTELEKNPVLETEIDSSEPDLGGNDSTDSDEWLDKILKLDEENRYIKGSRTYRSEDEEERRQHYLDSIVSEQTFQEILIEQLRFLELDKATYECCEAVISGLDDDGYLKSHPADLAMASGQSLDNVKRAIRIIQQLEPAGVCAANLKERLMLQLERKGRANSLTYRVVSEYLDDLAANHLPQVAKKLGVDIEKIKDVIEEIQTLNPRLSNETVSPHEYIKEEVFVDEEEGEIKVKINNEYLPSLYISKHYKEILNDPNTPKETRDYIKDKIHSGVFLINSIIQRQTTIRKIVMALTEEQRDFFLEGREHMKPLTMSKIAEKIGIHETTVSRAVSGKYLRCKHGLISIRDFFTSGYETDDGKSISNNVVKDAIRQLIDTEDPYSPLSDSDIADKLSAQGYKVARRTVAKYRESMNILSSNLRKQY